jgi:hypothetical protein
MSEEDDHMGEGVGEVLSDIAEVPLCSLSVHRDSDALFSTSACSQSYFSL